MVAPERNSEEQENCDCKETNQKLDTIFKMPATLPHTKKIDNGISVWVIRLLKDSVYYNAFK